jgi:hypothetical protein
LRSAASGKAKARISLAVSNLARDDDCCRALIAAGACEAVADALRSAASDDARAQILRAIRSLRPNEDS